MVPLLAVTALVAANGCSHTVGGTARQAPLGAAEPGRNYGYADNRCGLLDDSSVQTMVGAQEVVRPYSGAVCQYVLSRSPVMIDVTFSWFDTGSLGRERMLAAQLGEQVSDTEVERHQAFLARRSTTGVQCSATAAVNPGVLSWSVQFRNQSAGDPCPAAERLLSATLSAEL